MRDQLRLLEELQRHDAKLQEVESVIKALPEKLAAAESALLDLEHLLTKERTEITETEVFRKGQADEQRDAEEALSKAKAKLSQVKNLREANAMQREVETNRRSIDTRQEEVSKLGAALDAQQQKLAEHEALLAAERTQVETQRSAMEQRLIDLKGQLNSLRGSREEAAKRLKPDVLRKYGTIRMRRGLAVVAVKDGTCRGCNMNIPPQLYNTLQRGSSLEVCPNCNRIIYWAKLLEEAATP